MSQTFNAGDRIIIDCPISNANGMLGTFNYPCGGWSQVTLDDGRPFNLPAGYVKPAPLVIHATEGTVVNDPCPACGQPVPNSDLGCDCPHCGHEGQLPDAYDIPHYTVGIEQAKYDSVCCECGKSFVGNAGQNYCSDCDKQWGVVEQPFTEKPAEQPVVVVVTVSGGVAEVAYAPGINVVVVDFDNIDAGDSAADVLSELASEGVSLDNPPADLADTVKCLRDYALEQERER